LFDILKYLAVDKLREGIKLLLVKQSDKVVAEPPHLALSVEEGVLKNTASGAVHISFLFLCLLNPLFLNGRLSECPLSSGLLKEHQNKSANLVSSGCLLLRAVSEQDRDLITFEHDIGEEEFKTVLQFKLLRRIGLRLFLLEGLFIYPHVTLFN